jgi:hypothetical protein
MVGLNRLVIGVVLSRSELDPTPVRMLLGQVNALTQDLTGQFIAAKYAQGLTCQRLVALTRHTLNDATALRKYETWGQTTVRFQLDHVGRCVLNSRSPGA